MLDEGTEGYPCTWSHSRTHTHTIGRTPLDEWSARLRHLCLTTRNTHNRQTSIALVGLTWSHSRTHTYTIGRTPLNEWSARLRHLCLTKRNTHNRQTSIALVGLRPKIPASKLVETHALNSTTTGIGQGKSCLVEEFCYMWHHIKHFADRIICPPAKLPKYRGYDSSNVSGSQ